MASIYSRIDKKKNKKYYCSIYHNGKRIRKFLGNSKELAEASLKKLEYKLLFNIQNFYTKYQIPSYEKAILSFLKDVERTSVKFKQVSDIDTNLNYFKKYFRMSVHVLYALYTPLLCPWWGYIRLNFWLNIGHNESCNC